jgi:hypothetical protein
MDDIDLHIPKYQSSPFYIRLLMYIDFIFSLVEGFQTKGLNIPLSIRLWSCIGRQSGMKKI